MDNHAKFRMNSVLKGILICLFALSIPLLLILYSVQVSKYTELSKSITALETKQEQLIEENKRLVSDISYLSSAERIEKIATEELDMHKVESDDIIRVEMKGDNK